MKSLADAVNIIVTCTKTKTLHPSRECQLRSVPNGTVEERAAEWVRRLKRHASEGISAAELYSGGHWHIVRNLDSSRFKIRTWVCSAGYGLIHLGDRIAAYSATFSVNHPDSVRRGVSDTPGGAISSAWWDCLASWPGPSRGSPRSLAQLVEAYPKSPVIVVASERYLDALRDDLKAATELLADHENLMIISAGTKTLGDLNRYLIPCDARLQALLGGARGSLNIRLARKVLIEARSRPRLAGLKRLCRRTLERQPPSPVYDRHPMTDMQVRAYIRKELNRHPKQAHTPMLREMRNQGFACEYSRFSALYKQVRSETNGR